MPEITDAGMYKEWWANPAVVGLMGFAATTMATGLHNVGYSGDWPDAGVGNRLRGHGPVRCGSHRPSERKHIRRIRLHELRRLLVGDICIAVRAAERGPQSGSQRAAWFLPHVDAVHTFPFASPPCAWVSILHPVLAAAAGVFAPRRRDPGDRARGAGRLGNLCHGPARLVYRQRDLGQYGLRPNRPAAFLSRTAS